MQNNSEAYLDIETTGLAATSCQITVIGIDKDSESDIIQLVAGNITRDSLLAALSGVDIIYTYNGSRFDLPFIRSHLGIKLEALFRHRDLMYDCWNYNLYGGLKRVERQLGIGRQSNDISGWEAVKLWWRYINYQDSNALKTLLDYNREDVSNLRVLKERLIGH